MKIPGIFKDGYAVTAVVFLGIAIVLFIIATTPLISSA